MITWRTLGDAVATVLGLGWTTADPDTVRQSSDSVAAVRLLRPAGAALRLTLHAGAPQRWDLDLLHSADSTAVAVILDGDHCEVLTLHADPPPSVAPYQTRER